jgi:hypothetical protein
VRTSLFNPVLCLGTNFRYSLTFLRLEGNMKNVFIALIASLSVVLSAGIVEAGGGSKNNAQVRAVNDSSNSETVAVFLNSGTNGNTTVQGVLPGTTIDSTVQSQFNAQHGHLIAPGSSFTFTGLAAGDYTLTSEFLGNGGTTTGQVSTQSIHVNKGQTVTVTFTGDSETGTTATVSPVSAGL